MLEPKTPGNRKPDLSFKMKIKAMPTMKFKDNKDEFLDDENNFQRKATAFVENLDALLDEQKNKDGLDKSLSLISYNTSIHESNLSNDTENQDGEEQQNNDAGQPMVNDYKSNAPSLFGGAQSNYSKIIDTIPPNPLLPKNFGRNASPQHGGGFRLIKLMKFRGMDDGRSLFRENDAEIDQVIFPSNTTLKQVFQTPIKPPESAVPPSQPAKDAEAEEQYPNLTEYGQIVYIRDVLDFSLKKNFMGRRDQVLEENLLDVKRLLKNSQVAIATQTVAETKKTQLKINIPKNYYTRKDDKDITLIFESRFESGNLAAACKVNDYDYHLLLQNDVNTGGHTQWFFFKAENVSKGQYRFNMLNLCKPDSLYNEGMKVLCYSERKAQEKNIGWYRAGTKISYYQNNIQKEQNKNYYKSYYTHTFTYEFEYENDKVFFAYCYPYTYTDCIEELNRISNDPLISQFCTRKTLCETLAGNKCEILTITSRQNWDNFTKRKGVVITARVHPGESVGSWMMKGALDFLTDPHNPEAEILRQNYVFKVVPMLNPDGVINGNYRCSLAGCDLNRRWKAPSKVLHPTIYYTKQMIHKFSKERELAIFCDFHGHSRRKNIFMYGCNRPDQPEDSRLFPFLMGAICPHFIYSDSRFGNQKSKESTARMSLFNELKQHPAIYTMESSFCGNNMGQYAKYHFSTENLAQTGRDFCRALLLYGNFPAPPEVLSNYIQNINSIYYHYKRENEGLMKSEKDPDVEAMKLYEEKMKFFKEEKEQIQTKHVRKALLNVLRQHADVMSDVESTSSAGSDNFPSEDNLDPEEIAEVLPIQEDPNLISKLRVVRSKSIKFNVRKGPRSISPMKKDASEQRARFQRKNTVIDEVHKRDIIYEMPENELSIKTPRAQSGMNDLSLKPVKINQTEEETKPVEDPDPKVQVESDKTKKKLRKNIESKDACTQTERSDYMLIKQRQVQRENFLAAQQKALQQVDEVSHVQQQLLAPISGSQSPNKMQQRQAMNQQKSFQMRIPGGLIQINQQENNFDNNSNSKTKQSKLQRYTNNVSHHQQQPQQNNYTAVKSDYTDTIQLINKEQKQKMMNTQLAKPQSQTLQIPEDQNQAQKRRKSAEKTYQVRNISSAYNQHALRMKSQVSKSHQTTQQQSQSFTNSNDIQHQQPSRQSHQQQVSNANTQPIEMIKSSWEQAIANSSVTNSAISQWIMKKNKDATTFGGPSGASVHQMVKKQKEISTAQFNINSQGNNNDKAQTHQSNQRQIAKAMSPTSQNKQSKRITQSIIQSLRSKQNKNAAQNRSNISTDERPNTSYQPSMMEEQSRVYAHQVVHTDKSSNQQEVLSQTTLNIGKQDNSQNPGMIQSQNNLLSLLPTEKIEDSSAQKVVWSAQQNRRPIATIQRRQISFQNQTQVNPQQSKQSNTPRKKTKSLHSKTVVSKYSKTAPKRKISSGNKAINKNSNTTVSPKLDETADLNDFYRATAAYQESLQKSRVLENSFIKQKLEQQEQAAKQKLVKVPTTSDQVQLLQQIDKETWQKHKNALGNSLDPNKILTEENLSNQSMIRTQSSNGAMLYQGTNYQNFQPTDQSQANNKSPAPKSKHFRKQGVSSTAIKTNKKQRNQNYGKDLTGLKSDNSFGPTVSSVSPDKINKSIYKPGTSLKKGHLASLGSSGHIQPDNQQFIHVQRIVPSHQTYYQQNNSSGIGGATNSSGPTNKGVKISIVNVHNEYNIQNNYIIQGQQQVQKQDQTKESKTKPEYQYQSHIPKPVNLIN